MKSESKSLGQRAKEGEQCLAWLTHHGPEERDVTRSDDGSGNFDDLRGVSIVVDRDEAVDIDLDSGSSELEECGPEERDAMVADRDGRGRLKKRVENHRSQSVRGV